MAQSPTTNDIKSDTNAAANEASRDIKDGASRIADDVRKTARDLSENTGAERLADRGAAMANEALEAGREYVERARESGREYAERARHQAEYLYEAGQQTAYDVAHYAEDRYDEVSQMVRRHPAQALGLAAGIGFLVGLMISRR